MRQKSNKLKISSTFNFLNFIIVAVLRNLITFLKPIFKAVISFTSNINAMRLTLN